jgi:D-glycero-D-manno-heptose 1,7-bisphosphate phosphatase
LDRDGVIVRDVDLVTSAEQFELFPYAPDALIRLRKAGFALIVVTNQPAVARGLITEAELRSLHEHLRQLLRQRGADVDAIYVCSHHPDAIVPALRVECDCRKPRPGLLHSAARELDLALSTSFLVGDRASDIAAGARAGCRTVLVRTGKHLAPPIVSPDAFADVRADHACQNLAEATDWILGK